MKCDEVFVHPVLVTRHKRTENKTNISYLNQEARKHERNICLLGFCYGKILNKIILKRYTNSCEMQGDSESFTKKNLVYGSVNNQQYN